MTALGGRFWRLFGASATSNFADGIGRTALPLLGATYTRNPVLISGLVTFAFLPWLLFALPSGVLVDRVDRRYAMAAANAVRAAATGVLAILVLADAANIAALYVVAFALGIAETVYDSAVRAILPQVVDTARLDAANGALTVEESLGQTFLGAPLGSFIFTVALSLPFALNAGGFAVAAVLVLTLRGNYRPVRAAGTRSVRADIADGVRWLAAHRLLRSLTLISAVTAVANAMMTGVLVLYVLEVLRLPPGDFGLLLVAAGIGAALGGVLTPKLTGRLGRVVMLPLGAAVAAITFGAMGLTRNGYVAAGLFAVSAAAVMVWNVLTMSLRQALIPHELFGRVQGAYRTLVWGAIPVGALSGGLLAHLAGIRAVFLVGGAIMLACAGWLAITTRAHADALVLESSGDRDVVEHPGPPLPGDALLRVRPEQSERAATEELSA
ncbi:MAG TPA: MFS transporter [Jatrophihabitantaceae bacterium]|nr:MFS transporter [Jatrophihabitantaceae bacterium]